MKVTTLTILLIALSASLMAQSETRSTIGSYYIGLGYRGYSDDISDFDSLVIDSNFPVHPNFDLGVGGYIGSVSVLNYDLMSYGVDIEGYMTKPCVVKIKSKKIFSIILTEGKKHQIRRMCAALGFQVTKLKRVRMMNIKLGSLPTGASRALRQEEKIGILKKAGII